MASASEPVVAGTLLAHDGGWLGCRAPGPSSGEPPPAMSLGAADPPIAATAAPRFTYQPALDGWRGIGILAVMIYHGGLRDWIPGAFFWIDGFFTVSAFLIATLLLQEHGRSGRI